MEKIVEKKGKKFLFKVEDSADHTDYLKYEELREEIWQWPGDSLASTRNMMCENFFYDGSALYIAVFAESEGGDFLRQDLEHLVGFAYGFVGVRDKQVGFRALDNLWLYSQYTGVKPGYESFGLGVRVKEFQKEALINLFGLYTISCTYDPLTGINAHRNIHTFGMEAIDYHADIYGQFGGRLNRVDVPSDRFAMLWDLRKKVHRESVDIDALLERQQIVTNVVDAGVECASGVIEMETLRSIDVEKDNGYLLVEIPFDFYRMLRETDVEDAGVRAIPLDWRMGIRETFQSYLKKDYRVFDFRQAELEGRKRSFYVLKR
jgi:predicted GNAT superfamily acetyltransferase